MNAVLLVVEPEVIILVESRHGVMTGPSRSGTRLRFLGTSIGLSTVIVLLDMAWRAEHNPCAGPTPAPQPSSTIVPWPSQKSSRTPREGRTLCSPVSLSTRGGNPRPQPSVLPRGVVRGLAGLFVLGLVLGVLVNLDLSILST